jgi:hypothetical protein
MFIRKNSRFPNCLPHEVQWQMDVITKVPSWVPRWCQNIMTHDDPGLDFGIYKLRLRVINVSTEPSSALFIKSAM